MDEENVFLSLYAKKLSPRCKKITKINRLTLNDIIDDLSVGSIISPKHITAEYILQYVRAKQNAMGNNVETLYKLVEDEVEALEFNISEKAPIIGVPLHRMNLKDQLIICGIIRGEEIILPSGDDIIEAGDRVIVVTSQKKLNDVGDILK